MIVGPVGNGAQRASAGTRIALVIALAMLASVVGLAASAASPRPTLAATASWIDVEAYYLKLVNCTRTGGWVRTDGTCKGYGSGRYSRYVAPLKRSYGISDVSRSWARHLAVYGACTHGDPGLRLRRAGYDGWRWGENIGCGDGYRSAYKSVLASHRRFQAEKGTGGGHWKNIKNPAFRWIGIGVWKANGHTRLVTDFYAS
jgi:hypothetical protein